MGNFTRIKNRVSDTGMILYALCAIINIIFTVYIFLYLQNTNYTIICTARTFLLLTFTYLSSLASRAWYMTLTTTFCKIGSEERANKVSDSRTLR